MSVATDEAAAMGRLERHVTGAFEAIRELRACRSRFALRELRLVGALASIRALRVFLRREHQRSQVT